MPSSMNDLAERLTKTERVSGHPNRRPKDAATLLVIDRSGDDVRLLMGRRHDRHAFMPGMFVFPGGRVDAGDSRVPIAGDYHPEVAAKLMCAMRGPKSAARARALGVAAIRETFEEAGVLLGKPHERTTRAADWNAFRERRIVPDLSTVRFIARAITPPRRPRRFDTRFLVMPAEAIADTLAPAVGPSGELEEVRWVSIEEARAQNLPTITKTVLDELMRRLDDDPALPPTVPVPFYYWRHGTAVRDLL
jgi:8-oxo-dGTP pyrophosphatase MutT (NUDIX family)